MSTSLDMIRRRPVPAAERLVLIASVGIRLHPLYFRRMNSVKHSAQPAAKNQAQGPPSRQGVVGRLRARGPARQTLRRQWLVPLLAAYGNAELDQRLVIRGRKRELGLGSVALVSLAEAREQALANRKLARPGGDPLAEKRRTQGVPNFAKSAVRVMEQKRTGWRSPHHNREGISSLRRYEPEAAICDLKMPCHAEGIISKEAWG